ncbi:MAG: 2OG-Fe(II) oxygenase [Bacteroidota bacterium]
MKLTQHNSKIWTIENFFSIKECQEFIYLSEVSGYEEATVSLPTGVRMMKGVRNNDRLIHQDEALAARLWKRLAPFCPEEIDGESAVGLNERFRFYRYEEGQRFKRHIDGRFRKSETLASRITFMVYLNEDYEGGQTRFADLEITPKTGQALCFIHEQKHESVPLRSGVKYVLRSDVLYGEI